MLLISLSLFLTLIPCMGWGIWLSRLLYKKEVELFQVFLTGLCGLLWLSQCVSLFSPVNMWLHSVLFILAVVPIIQYRKRLFVWMGWWQLMGIVLLVILVVLNGLPVPRHSDSQFYHSQAVQWAAQYPLVPGLGNLFGRLAFNSSWFVGQATFSLSPLVQGTPYTLNLLLFLVWMAYLLKRIYSSSSFGPKTVLDLGFLIISLAAARGWLSSPAPDVATCIFMFVCCRLLIVHALFEEDINIRYLLLLFASAIAVKVSACLLLPLLFTVQGIWLRKNLLSSIVLGSIILLPWLVRNYILSGYIVYPFFQLSFLSPDWKVSLNQAAVEAGWIKSWARCMGPEYYYVGNQPLWEWIGHWWSTLEHYTKIMMQVTAGAVVANLLKIIITRKARKPMALALLFLIPIGIWVSSAPDTRFGFGVLLPFLLLLILMLLPRHFPPLKLNTKYIALAGLLAIGYHTYFVTAKGEIITADSLIVTPDFPAADCREININGISVAIPKEGNCYNHPIPCVNDILVPHNIKARGKRLEDGFRLE